MLVITGYKLKKFNLLVTTAGTQLFNAYKFLESRQNKFYSENEQNRYAFVRLAVKGLILSRNRDRAVSQPSILVFANYSNV